MSKQRSPATASESRSSHDAARDHLLHLIARLLARHWRRWHDQESQAAASENSPAAANTPPFDRDESPRYHNREKTME
jgi:hypothetical protein